MWAKAQKYNGRGKGRLMLDGNILEDRDFSSGGAETNGYKIKETLLQNKYPIPLD